MYVYIVKIILLLGLFYVRYLLDCTKKFSLVLIEANYKHNEKYVLKFLILPLSFIFLNILYHIFTCIEDLNIIKVFKIIYLNYIQ